MDTQIYLNVPTAQLGIFKDFVERMGWYYEVREDLLRQFMASRPQDVDITDNEIVEELMAVRHPK